MALMEVELINFHKIRLEKVISELRDLIISPPLSCDTRMCDSLHVSGRLNAIRCLKRIN
jgi:hypothetical protein